MRGLKEVVVEGDAAEDKPRALLGLDAPPLLASFFVLTVKPKPLLCRLFYSS